MDTNFTQLPYEQTLNDTTGTPNDNSGRLIVTIVIPVLVVITIICTILVWKFGPLNRATTWPADLGIFCQCAILLFVAVVHLGISHDKLKLNGPILMSSALIGIIIQFIEEKF